MPILFLLVGAIVLITALNNTHGDLAKYLEQDIPGFFKWGAAIAAVIGLGYVPGLEKPSRWLLALVLLVIVLTQYQAILDGFKNFAGSGSQATASGGGTQDPTSAYVANPSSAATPTPTQISGSGSGATDAGTPSTTTPTGTPGTALASAAPHAAAGMIGMASLDPGSLLSSFTQSIGFGGSAA